MSEQMYDEGERSGLAAILRAWPYAVGLLIVLALAWFVYGQMTAVRGVAVEASSPLAIEMLPQLPEEQPLPKEEAPTEPTEQPTPTPSPSPSAEPEAPAPMTMDAAAQAGVSPFNITSGDGAGEGAPTGPPGRCMVPPCSPEGGTGARDPFYSRYMGNDLQQRVQRDESVNRQVFSADFAIVVSASGAVTSARVLRSSGSPERDRRLAQILMQARGLRPPPPTMVFPQTITVRGRRSS